MEIRHIKLAPIIGFGYWKDDYSDLRGIEGCTHNIILPFIRIQFGHLKKKAYEPTRQS